MGKYKRIKRPYWCFHCERAFYAIPFLNAHAFTDCDGGPDVCPFDDCNGGPDDISLYKTMVEQNPELLDRWPGLPKYGKRYPLYESTNGSDCKEG